MAGLGAGLVILILHATCGIFCSVALRRVSALCTCRRLPTTQVLRLWEAIWSGVPGLHLYLCVAVLEHHRRTILRQALGREMLLIPAAPTMMPPAAHGDNLPLPSHAPATCMPLLLLPFPSPARIGTLMACSSSVWS